MNEARCLLLCFGLCCFWTLGGCGSKSGGAPYVSRDVSDTSPRAVVIGTRLGPGEPPQMLSNPLAEDPLALQEGRRLFVDFNCSGCHGGHGGGGMGPSLRDDTWIYGGSDAQIFDSIAVGRTQGMPAWGTRLPSRELWKLVAYIESLGSDHEPQPPA